MIDKHYIIILIDKRGRYYGCFGGYSACAAFLQIPVKTLKYLLSEPNMYIPIPSINEEVRPKLEFLKNRVIAQKRKKAAHYSLKTN
jgi:hypothetical protein